MPRKPLRLQTDFPYHVTARSNNRDWFFLPSNEIWDISHQLLRIVVEKYNAEPIEFVLMSNHFHILMATPLGNLDRIMNYFMREFAKRVGSKTGRINHIFGGRYKGCVLQNSLYFAHAYKYVLRNPVAAKMVNTVGDYPFSSYQRELKIGSWGHFKPITEHSLGALIPKPFCERSEWLNTEYPAEQAELLRRTLKRTIFKFPTHHRHESVVVDLERLDGRK